MKPDWAPGPHTDAPGYNRAYARYTEWVPTATMALFREYRRTRTENPARWDQLLAEIAAQGILDPLILLYNPRNGAALLGEGNRRLAVAEALQWRWVPVRVHRATTLVPGHPLTSLSEFAPRVVPDARLLTDGYVPSDLRPSAVLPDYLLQEPDAGAEPDICEEPG